MEQRKANTLRKGRLKRGESENGNGAFSGLEKHG